MLDGVAAENRDARRRVVVFLALTFAVSAVFYALIIAAGTLRARDGLYVLGLMWTPGIVGIVTTLAFQRNLRGMGWGWGGTRYQAIAYVLPLLYGGAMYLAIWGLGLGGFSTANIGERSLPEFVGIAATLGVLLSLLTATGEEIGWRGVLVPQLARTSTLPRVALVSGAIWAVWHYPLLLFADYNNGGTPVLYGLACFTVFVVGLSFAFAWLRLRSGSFWPAALLHATHNLFIQSVFGSITTDTGPTEFFEGEFGLFGALAGVVVAVTVLRFGFKPD